MGFRSQREADDLTLEMWSLSADSLVPVDETDRANQRLAGTFKMDGARLADCASATEYDDARPLARMRGACELVGDSAAPLPRRAYGRPHTRR